MRAWGFVASGQEVAFGSRPQGAGRGLSLGESNSISRVNPEPVLRLEAGLHCLLPRCPPGRACDSQEGQASHVHPASSPGLQERRAPDALPTHPLPKAGPRAPGAAGASFPGGGARSPARRRGAVA